MSGADLTSGVWPAVTTLPLVGLALAFVLIIVFTVVRIQRLRRDAQDDR
jgi:flagellar biogenesis protein FliO